MNCSSRKLHRMMLAGAMAVSLSWPSRADADSVVTNFTESALRAAMSGGGRVAFATNGSIALTQTIEVTNTVNPITLDAAGYTVTLSGGFTGDLTTNGVRLFSVLTNVPFTLRGLTLANGRSTNGGALHNRGTLVLTNCIITNCAATGRNGVDGVRGADNDSGSADNGGNGGSGREGLGGALWNVGTTTIQRCKFFNNLAVGGDGGAGGNGGNGTFSGGNGGSGGNGARGLGGAIYGSGPLTITASTFKLNLARGGEGGLGGTNGTGVIASYSGNGGSGALGAAGAIYSLGVCDISGSTFTENHAAGGSSAKAGSTPDTGRTANRGADSTGGGLCSYGTLALVNCTFYTNSATAGDGGEGGDGQFNGGRGGDGGVASGGNLFSAGTAGVTHCTLASGAVVGGFYGLGGAGRINPGPNGSPGIARGDNIANLGAQGSLTLRSSILNDWVTVADYYGWVADAGFNIISPGSTLPNATSMSTNALLDVLAENGGPTETMSLLEDSPAINAGGTNAFPATDQRGVRRPIDGTNDIGAFESGVEALPPVITQNPTNQTVGRGSNAWFSVTVEDDTDVTYQWTFYGTNISPARVPSATHSTLQLTNVQTTDAGTDYAVIVQNKVGAVTSAPATLTVIIPLRILEHPKSQTNRLGSDVEFMVRAECSSPLSYVWTHNSTNTLSGSASNYTILGVKIDQAGAYQVKVRSGATGEETNSDIATLTILVEPTITVQPTNVLVTLGQIAIFDAQATGTLPLDYQWFFKDKPLERQTNHMLTLSSVQKTNEGNYQVIVTNLAGAGTSVVARLAVGIPPSIMIQPTNVLVYLGSNTSFTVVAAGDPPLRYQWYSQRTNAVPQGTNAFIELTPTNASSVGVYTVVVTNNYGSITSTQATLTLLIAPVITREPTHLTVIQGANATFDVEATGSPAPHYQWFFNDAVLTGKTNRVLTLTNVQKTNEGKYSVTATNLAGGTSSVAQLTVGVPPAISQPPTNAVVFEGDPAAFTVTATGDNPLAYQWRLNGIPIAEATTPRYAIASASATHAGSYTVVVTNLFGSATSPNASLIVHAPLHLASQSPSQIAPLGSDVMLSVAAEGRTNIYYQWQKDGVLLPGASTNSRLLRAVKASQAGTYEVELWNDFGEFVLSDPMRLTLFTLLSDQTVTESNSVAFAVTATGPADAPPLDFQWFHNGAAITGATANRYEITNARTNDAGEYRVAMRDSAGTTNSTAATLVVWRLHYLRAAKNGASFQVTFASQLDQTYTLEYTTSLPATNWTNEDSKFAETNVLTLSDSHATNAMRFYRIRLIDP